MATASPYSAKDEQALMTELWDPQIAENPEAFVMFVYPWGKEGSPLERFKGPKNWQRDELQKIADHIKSNKLLMAQDKTPVMYRSATVSGRGPGKSTLFSWLTHWMMSCQVGSTTTVTANTEPQLKTKTWAELGKWHTLAINGHWFDRQALSLKPQAWLAEGIKKSLQIDSTYYSATALLWSEENQDAFAGTHNLNGEMVIFDEASGIPPKIWSVTDASFTDPILHRYWFVFSNGRRNTGTFYECFHRFRDHWQRRQIDSRKVEGADLNFLNSIIERYGEDSDEARVEVKGEFPSQGDKQFISREIVEGARDRELIPDDYASLIMGVDPARFGDDKSVIRFRQGRNARIIEPLKFKGLDNVELANKCAELISKYDPDAVAIDAGNGTGVIDALKHMGYRVHEVWFGSKSSQAEYANKRTELWAEMRDWLKGACIDQDNDLKDDLVGPEYGFMGRSDQMMLESKERMKSRGVHSPDDADALACTFAVRPPRRDSVRLRGQRKGRTATNVDFSVFGE